ncbi:MAG: spore germination protein [Christensenellaceae bacterium]|jgi:spore germination protein KA|nr:spore germination protein [Christensenellaceae bacterium]
MRIKLFHANDIDCQLSEIKSSLGNSFDVVVDKVLIANKEHIITVYLDGFIDRDLMNRDIIKPLKESDFDGNIELRTNCICKRVQNISQFADEILTGQMGVWFRNIYFLFDIKKWEKRPVQTPDAENVTRGPKEGFTEDLITNTVLIRRKLRTSQLILEQIKIGRKTKTHIALGYINNVASQDVVKQIKTKLKSINVDGITESGKIEQYLENKPFASVSGIGMTQKPDIVVTRLLDGKVIILCDGTPHVLTIPEFFIDNFKTAEDHYHRIFFGTFLRLMRVIGFLLSVFLPGVAVAITTYNREMLPVSYLETIIGSVANTPFPQAVEILFLIVMLELLKESGTRLPKTIGSAVSIVGALIVGDAAVRAGIVSAPSVMIVALTAVSSFVIPNLNEFTTIFRLLFLALGAFLGLLGIGIGLVLMIAQLASINSFGETILKIESRNGMINSIIRLSLKKQAHQSVNRESDRIQKIEQHSYDERETYN